MPRKVSTGKRPSADAAAAATQAPAKKTCPHRTPQTPFESGDKETTYIVDKMVGTRWNQGSREYLVRWKGYAEAILHKGRARRMGTKADGTWQQKCSKD